MPGSASPPTSPAAQAVPARAWLLLTLLTTFNVLNFVDRQLITSLAPLLMNDLGLSRSDIGLLAGFGFVVVYTAVGLFAGLASDRWPRRWLVGAGVALWSVMTAASGAASGFAGLAVPRLFVGVGQATLTPAAVSMLADVIPARRMGMATSLYYIGLPVGSALGLMASGWIAPRYGWQAPFVVFGLVGVVAVALLAALREPPRCITGGTTAAAPSVAAIVRDLMDAVRARPALILVMAGSATLTYGSSAAMHRVTWLVEERGVPFAQATILAGLIAVASGFAGNLVGGWCSDWCRRRWAGGRSWSLVMLTVCFAPFSVGFFTLPPGSPAFYVCWFVSTASTVAFFGPVFAAVQELSPAHTRSSAVALCLFVMNMLGVGPGPWITGLIGDQASLTLGLLTSVAVGLVGAGLFVCAARLTPDDRAGHGPSA